MQRAQLLFLGTGGSLGIPVIGCRCSVCRSSSPFNRRLRSSVCLRCAGRNFVIDVGPDFRTQALRYRIDRLDGVLLTHAHYDHVAGIDELRIYPLRQKRALPCLLSEETFGELERRHHYCVSPRGSASSTPARLVFHPLEGESGEEYLAGLKVRYFSYKQVDMKVSGFRFHNFAYVTDMTHYEEGIFRALEGVEILVVSGRWWEGSVSHMNSSDVVAFAKRVGPKKIYFTHISHEVDHGDRSRVFPENVELAYDGMRCEIEVECDWEKGAL